MIQAIGMGAAICTTVAFLPQVLKTFRTRSARDLSLAMLAIFNLGLVLWLWYGILIDSKPVMIANAATLVLALALLIYKIVEGEK